MPGNYFTGHLRSWPRLFKNQYALWNSLRGLPMPTPPRFIRSLIRRFFKGQWLEKIVPDNKPLFPGGKSGIGWFTLRFPWYHLNPWKGIPSSDDSSDSSLQHAGCRWPPKLIGHRLIRRTVENPIGQQAVSSCNSWYLLSTEQIEIFAQLSPSRQKFNPNHMYSKKVTIALQYPNSNIHRILCIACW